MPGRLTIKARGQKRRVPGEMTKTEQRFRDTLLERQSAGEIAWWYFEPVRLTLGKNVGYLPDFMVFDAEGFIVFYEVKGSAGYHAPNQDKSRVKIKVAAETYPEFRFVSAVERRQKDGGGFVYEEIEPR